MSEKLALFLPSLFGGGAERVMVNLANQIADKGFKVDLLVGNAESTYKNQVSSKVNLVDFQTSRSIHTLPKLIGYLRREKPKALISALKHTNVLAVWAKRLALSSTNIIITEHTSASLMHFQDGYTPSKIRATLLAMRLFYPMADHIIAVSQGVAEDLSQTIGLNPKRLEVIYNPVLNEAMFQKANQPLDHPWFQPGQPPVILGVGRLEKLKDFPNLLRAFALLRQKQEARLIILGEGNLRKSLEALIKELGIEHDVELPGFNNNPYAFMKNAQVFALSSILEGLPTVLIEAMALGTPVVSTDCKSGPKEIISHAGYGTLVPIQDPEALALALENTLHAAKPVIDQPIFNRYTSNEATLHYLRTAGFKV